MSAGRSKEPRKREQAIAALLTEPTQAQAAAKAGISEATLQRWLNLPEFRAAYRKARRRLVEGAVGRIQAATGQAVDTLLEVARGGAKDGDRVRAAVALLDHALRGLPDADDLHGRPEPGDASAMAAGDVAQVLAARLRQVEQSELSTGEKGRVRADAGGVEPAPSPATPPARRLTVDLDPKEPSVTLDGTRHPVGPLHAAFVQALIDKAGDWVSSTELCKIPELVGSRLDRIRKQLPSPIHKLIESRPGAGYRLSLRSLA
jgi:hypothetical protein